MIKFENTEVIGWKAAIRGMRNPMNSWEKGDSLFIRDIFCDDSDDMKLADLCGGIAPIVGDNDLDLMKRLQNAGADHRKFMRMIVVYVDITAPSYFWKEFDTYKIGTVANSTSTMHCIHKKEFTLEDFSTEHLFGDEDMLKWDERTDIAKDHALAAVNVNGDWCYFSPKGYIQMTCNMLNRFRQLYLETKDKKYWWQMIQLLPFSYHYTRTVMMNYEVLANIYKSRKNHKLDEWAEHEEMLYTTDLDGNKKESIKGKHGFCDWITTLPYSELITGENNDT